MIEVARLRAVLRVLAPVVVAAAACLAAPLAQEPPAATDAEAAPERADRVRDAYDPTVPAGAVRGYIEACRAGDYVGAAAFLNLESIAAAEREQRGPELARRLKIVLDRKLWIHYEQLSEQPQGDLDDGLPDDLERIPGSEEVQVFLERLPDDQGRRVWKFSASTVERIPALYDRYGYGPLGDLLPPSMFELRFLEIQLWQWIGLVLSVFLAYLLSWVVVQVIYRVARPFVERTETKLDDRLLQTLLPPVRLGIAVLFFTIGSYLLRLSLPAYELLAGIEKALAVIAVTWLALRAVDVASNVARERLVEADNRSAMAVLPLGRRVVKVFLLAIAVLAALQNLGFNITGLVAGLGVGGLAVALAAQKTIANLFGGVSLVTDQPVRVGDVCRFAGDKVGTVETIGLRSTRVRTLDRSLLTIPNADFSDMLLENLAVRDKMRLYTMLGLRYETTPDQLRYVLAGLRRLLAEHPRIDAEPARVRFVGFGASSLDLELFAYVLTNDWAEFLKIREDVYLRLMDVVEQSGTGFAFPSQTLYLGRDGGLDAERSRAAERKVREWRERGELPFPDFPPGAVEDFRDTADYPPRGSAPPRDEGGES